MALLMTHLNLETRRIGVAVVVGLAMLSLLLGRGCRLLISYPLGCLLNIAVVFSSRTLCDTGIFGFMYKLVLIFCFFDNY